MALLPLQQVVANSFKIDFNTSTQLFKYTIDVGDHFGVEAQGNRRTLSKETKRYLINQLLTDSRAPDLTQSAPHWACDYNSTIISAGALSTGFNSTNAQRQKLYCRTQPGQTNHPRDLQATITCDGPVNLAPLQTYVQGNTVGAMPSTVLDAMDALNIISWKRVNDMNFTGGRAGKRFFPNEVALRCENETPQMRQQNTFLIRRGFFTSMRPGAGSLHLNVSTTTSAFYSPIMLDTWMQLRWGNGQIDEPDFRRQLGGVKVMVVGAQNNQTWRIFDIGTRPLNQESFADDQHNMRIVSTYLTQHYPATPIDPNALCINVGNTNNPIWFARELLRIVEWQLLSRTLDGNDKTRMVNCAEIRPQQNKTFILGATQRQLGFPNGQGGTSFLNVFGLTPQLTLTQLSASQFRPPTVAYNNNTIVVNNASWNLRGQRFLIGANSPAHLGVISFNNLSTPKQNGIRNQLIPALRSYGTFSNNGTIQLHFGTVGGGLGQGARQFRRNCSNGLTNVFANLGFQTRPRILLVVLPIAGVDYYAEVKRWGDCVQGIPTVCVLEGKLGKFNDPGFIASLSVKINAKLGGVNHRVVREQTRGDGKGFAGAPINTMILGADVTHPGKDAHDSCPSLAAVVATNDNSSGHYLASARVQLRKKEIISDLETMVKERFLAWVYKNQSRAANIVPQMLLFYRDGVSESQYAAVASQEVPQIRRGCVAALVHLRATNPALYMKAVGSVNYDLGQWRCGIVLVVCTKRHHTRFYRPATNGQTNINLDPGMLFDATVVQPNSTNFFLQSHASSLGTAKNSYYTVIYNNDGTNHLALPRPNLLRITNQLCFTGARCSKGLSIATPARYADYVCDRLRLYMRPAMHRNLRQYQAFHPPPSTIFNSQGQIQPPGPVDYAGERALWQHDPNKGPNENPWHTDLDNIMFYI